jgi:ATP/maltotriose-dependent transcriptional regulator MalT
VERRLERVTDQIEGNTPAERLLLANVGVYRARRGQSAAEVASLIERALGEGKLLAEGTSDSLPLALSTYGLLFAERYDVVHRLLVDALQEARERGSAYGFVSVLTLRSLLAYKRGSITDAEADARAAVDVQRLHGWALPAPVAHLIDALIERGELEAAEEELEQFGLHGDLPNVLYYIPALVSRGRLRLEQGKTREGLQDLLQASDRIEQWRGADMYRQRSFAAIALHRLGDQSEARRLAEKELALARSWGTPGTLGIALRTCGLVDGGDAIELLRESVSVLETSEARLEHARSLTELGAALRRTNQRSDAREPLREALDIAHRCGATALAERAREELSATGAKPRNVMLTGVESLTASERRVAKMAAEGLANREIAQALFVTVKTVETHLGHAYQKLGIGSRKELTAALEGEQVTPRA